MTWTELNENTSMGTLWLYRNSYENHVYIKSERGHIYLFLTYSFNKNRVHVYECLRSDKSDGFYTQTAKNRKRLVERYYDLLSMEELL